jgi:arylsulfatase A-like enzyme
MSTLLRKSTCALLLLAVALGGCTRQAAPPPNIIFFLVDDMGWQDTSVPFWTERTPFNERYRTPGMERLAAEGMLFAQAYASAVCSPTRTSLMTGMNAARHRVTNWTLRRDVSQDAPDSLLEMPRWNVNGLQPADTIAQGVYATTLPQLLRENGYYTIHCGKAHWGTMGTPGEDPRNLGFDVNIAGHAAGGPGSFQGEYNYSAAWRNGGSVWDVPDLEKYHGSSVHLTEALTLEAIAALDRARETGKPFYLYMSHYAVHAPIEPHHPYYQQYLDRGLDETEVRYASMVEGMDKSLRDLMDYLDRNGLAGNTVILFMSDNGGLSAHARGGEPHTHNLPLRSGKGSAYEGGIRVPMLAKWPGRVKGGSVCRDYVIIEDFFPGILQMAGVEHDEALQPVDGRSFVPMLLQQGSTAQGRDLFWHYPNKWGGEGPGIGSTSTIRSGDWKLIYWYRDGAMELYNIAEDIGEHHNRAAAEPERVRELAGRLGRYLREVGADRPVLKASGMPAPWPDEEW